MTHESSVDEESDPYRVRKRFLTVALSALGVAGTLLAVLLLVGGDNLSGILTALAVLLADAFLLAAFFAKQEALRIVSWVLTGLMFAAMMVSVWVNLGALYFMRDDDSASCFDSGYGCYPDRVMLDDVMSSAVLSLFVLALIGVGAALLSLAYPRISGSVFSKRLYYGTLVSASIAGLLYAVSIMVESFIIPVGGGDYFVNLDLVYSLASAALALAGTGLAVIIVISLTSRKPGLDVVVPNVIDFQSPEAREAFLLFMKDYEFEKSSSFSLRSELGVDDGDTPRYF